MANSQSDGRPRKPNLLWLLADDHAGYVLGADGNRRARTPNMDRLASEGVRFARNFCNSPVCTPSRQCMLTGQLPHSAGVTVVDTPLSRDKPTVAKQLKAAGYYTAAIGKMHWNCKPDPPRSGIHGFDLPFADQVAWQAHRDSVQDRALRFHYWGAAMPVPPGIKTKPDWKVFLDPSRVWLNADKLPEPGYERDLRATFLVEQALDFMRDHREGPFALWVSFSEPHAPYAFPVEDRDAFDPADFPVPALGPDDWPQVPLIFRGLSDEDRRGIIAACYTSVQYVDRSVGRILRALKDLDLEENTLVIYTADHGAMLGAHGRFEKHCGYDQAMRTPLLMRFPRGWHGGRTVHALTESVDIPGTILEVLDAPGLPVNHGRSLVPLLLGRTETHRSHIFSEYLENEEAYIRTDEWKFIYCSGKRFRRDGYETENPTPGGYVKLFDLKRDPQEFRDISQDTALAPVVSEMKHLLLQRYLDTHPEASSLPRGLSVEDQLDFFVRPRDASFSGAGVLDVKYGIK
jgi:arylsulfatase A-like enzyme